jgi:hypothetical protein
VQTKCVQDGFYITRTTRFLSGRVLTAYVADVAPVYLLSVYAKSQRANVSKAEVNEWAKVMTALKAGVRGE